MRTQVEEPRGSDQRDSVRTASNVLNTEVFWGIVGEYNYI